MDFREGLEQFTKLVSAKKSRQAPPVCVGDVMTREVFALGPTQSFGEALGVMANRPFRHILVIHTDGKLAGVISDRDLLRTMGGTIDWKTKTVAEVMKSESITITPDAPISVAVQEILTRRINCLPVLDRDDKVCGIVTSTDLLNAFQKIQQSLERITS